MAEGSKPDVPLFQLLSDLLQQVRTQLCPRSRSANRLTSSMAADLGGICRAAALSQIWSVAAFRGTEVFVSSISIRESNYCCYNL